MTNPRAARARIAELERERDHWKANHDEAIARQRILTDRPDLPLERVRAAESLRQAQARIAELERVGNELLEDRIAQRAVRESLLRDVANLERRLAASPLPEELARILGDARPGWLSSRAADIIERTARALAEAQERLRVPCAGCPGCSSGDCPDARDLFDARAVEKAGP